MTLSNYAKAFLFLLSWPLVDCQNIEVKNQTNHASARPVAEMQIEKPKVSFTFDDGVTYPMATYPFEVWNEMILSCLSEANLQAAFFVTGSNKLDEKGEYLLQSWSENDHWIANHTYNHPNCNHDTMTAAAFERQLELCDSIISKYPTYTKWFRFPYLKEGKTAGQIADFRQVLKQHGYRNGHVTIDASDWYIQSALMQRLKKDPYRTDLEAYKAYYLDHLIDRATYYEKLAFELTGRHISHTLLLHHNLTSALFLSDLIQRFESEGWEVMDAKDAFQDDIYHTVTDHVPAGESLIWALAKSSGRYEEELRYPTEDSRYEMPAMKRLGLID